MSSSLEGALDYERAGRELGGLDKEVLMIRQITKRANAELAKGLLTCRYLASDEMARSAYRQLRSNLAPWQVEREKKDEYAAVARMLEEAMKREAEKGADDGV